MRTPIAPERRDRIAAFGYDYAAQPREALATCNLCASATFAIVTHRDRYGYPAEAHACMQCGLVFLNPRMTAEAYSRFYDGVYRPLVSAFHGRLIDAKTIQAEQRDYAVERASLLRPFVASGALTTMLDIGGSTGVVAHHFAEQFGLRGTLIDPAPLEVEEARRLGLETITGLVEARAAAADAGRAAVHRHRRLPRGLLEELVRRGRDQDRSPVLPDRVDDDLLSAPERVCDSASGLRGRSSTRELRLPRRAGRAARAAAGGRRHGAAR
jgi:hypothetical protein